MYQRILENKLVELGAHWTLGGIGGVGGLPVTVEVRWLLRLRQVRHNKNGKRFLPRRDNVYRTEIGKSQ